MESSDSERRGSSVDGPDVRGGSPPKTCSVSEEGCVSTRRYLHSGMTPRLNDVTGRSRHRSLPQPMMSDAADSSKTNSRTLPRDRREGQDQHETAAKKQRVLYLAHKRWRSSDRLNPQKCDDNSLSNSYRKTAACPSKGVLEGTSVEKGNFNLAGLDINSTLCESNDAFFYQQTRGNIEHVALNSLVKSEEDSKLNCSLESHSDDTLRGHPFIIEQCDSLRPYYGNTDTSKHDTDISVKGCISNYKSVSSGRGRNGVSPMPDLVDNNNTNPDLDTAEKTENIMEALNAESQNRPPRTGKSAWCGEESDNEDILLEKDDTFGRANNDDKGSVHEGNSRAVKHWANIDHRAATRNSRLSSGSDVEAMLPFAKSKSTWRLHAARARESVANLLNFTKGKDSCSSSSRRLQQDSKLHPHHKSSPCLNLPPQLDVTTLSPTNFDHSFSYGNFEKQTSSPELYQTGFSKYNKEVENSISLSTPVYVEEIDGINIVMSLDSQTENSALKTEQIHNSHCDSSSITTVQEVYRRQSAHNSFEVQGIDNLQTKGKNPLQTDIDKIYGSSNDSIDVVNQNLLPDAASSEHPSIYPISKILLDDNCLKEDDISDENRSNKERHESTTCEFDNSPNTSATAFLPTKFTASLPLETNLDQENEQFSEAYDSSSSPVGLVRTLQAAQQYLNCKRTHRQILGGNDLLISDIKECTQTPQNPTAASTDSSKADKKASENSMTDSSDANENEITTEGRTDSIISKDTLMTDSGFQGESVDLTAPSESYVVSSIVPSCKTDYNNTQEISTILSENQSLQAEVQTSSMTNNGLIQERCSLILNNVRILNEINNQRPCLEDKQSASLGEEKDCVSCTDSMAKMDLNEKNTKEMPAPVNDKVESSNMCEDKKWKRRHERFKRVAHMLDNQVFKKHLARHADAIEKRVLGYDKRGLRKALSNIDLSSNQSEVLDNFMNTLLTSSDQDSKRSSQIHGDDSDDNMDENTCLQDYHTPSSKITRCVSLYDRLSHQSIKNDEELPVAGTKFSCSSGKDKTFKNCLRKAASSFLLSKDVSDCKTDRRASLAGPSEVRQNQNGVVKEKRQRMYIPSFSEYRQKKTMIDDSVSQLEHPRHCNGNSVNDIYVIDETEADEVVPDVIKSSDEIKTRRQDKDPTFAHPAIVITPEHFTQMNDSLCSKETRSLRRSKKNRRDESLESQPFERHSPISLTSDDVKFRASDSDTLYNEDDVFNSVTVPGVNRKFDNESNFLYHERSYSSTNSFADDTDDTHQKHFDLKSTSLESRQHSDTMIASLGFSLQKDATIFLLQKYSSFDEDNSDSNASPLTSSPREGRDRDQAFVQTPANESTAADHVEVYHLTEALPGSDQSSDQGSKCESKVEGEANTNSVDVLHLSDASAKVCGEEEVYEDKRSGAGITLQRWSPTSSASDSDQSNKASVLRSTSDVSATLGDEKERRRRDRKERPYKSDPFTGTGARPQALLSPDTPTPHSLSASTSCSFHSLDELDEQSDSNNLYDDGDAEHSKRLNRLSNASSISEDSGVCWPAWGGTTLAGGCSHCAAYTFQDASSPSALGRAEVESVSSTPTESLCNKCVMKRRERKETIQEMAETEKRYGRDLAILRDEFYRPMKSTSLLTLDQLDAIFMNLDELITVHKHFMGKLTAALIDSVKEGDEGLSRVDIGAIFVESSRMFLAFENYCVRQTQSAALLDQLEKEKELLKVFLQATQNENAKMRRMHLKTFLMVPVQRVMKYPLLLGRVHRVTPCYHVDKANIRQARDNIEEMLELINSKTHIPSRTKSRPLPMLGYSLTEKMEVNRVALEVLGWTKKEVCDIITSKLWYGQVPDHTWASRRARNVKFNMVHVALLSHGRPTESPVSPRDAPQVLQVAMVLVREKGGKYLVVRDPLLMDRCVVTVDPQYDHVFEIHEQSKDTYLFKADSRKETRTWIVHLKQLSRNLGYWRRRRNGLPNVLLKTA